MEYIKRYHIKLQNNALAIIVTGLLLILCSCNIAKEGNEQKITLTEFQISNETLDSITDNYIHKINYDKKHAGIILISFECKNDTLNICYSLYNSMHEVSNRYLLQNNYRVIGYVNKQGSDIILMTNINTYWATKTELKPLIIPLDNTKDFVGLHYEPITKSNWGEMWISCGVDCICYKYINKNILGPFYMVN